LEKIGAHVAYINPSEGALSWLDNWAMTSGVKDKAAAEKWVNFLLQKKISGALTERTGFGNTVVPSGSAKETDKLVWLDAVEDPTKRSDLWNEVKAAP
jgi:putative spermidine/putrescine transport system substrate-binding protein